MVIEFELSKARQEEKNKDQKMETNNYSKSNFSKLRKYFRDIDWKRFNEAKGVQEKWDRIIIKLQ